MIELQHGNLLEADVEALVNTVNCVGIMGKGIALQFRQAYPSNYNAYQRACKHGKVIPGHMLTVETDTLVNPKFIINFPTKRHWKGKSRIEDIELGLQALVKEVERLHIQSIAIPPLGCGNGGLDWSAVFPLIRDAFDSLADIRVLVFEPVGAPDADKMPTATKKPRMTRNRALLVQLLHLYGIPGYKSTLLEIQKLAYFLQVAGENMELKFVAHKFGPYADNLNHALQDMEGHYIRGYGDRSSRGEVYPLPEAIDVANAILAQSQEATLRLERVRDLINGYESPYGLELLATVHWVAQRSLLAEADPSEVVAGVHAWNTRKRVLLKADHIRKALRRLQEQGWVAVATPILP